MIATIQQQMFSLQDLKYKDFQAKLMPGVDTDTIIGVRTPELRKLAREMSKDERIGGFLKILPHQYYDEMNMHGFIICQIKDYDECISELDRFLPYVDNWATCDLMRPKAFANKNNHQRLLNDIKRWMSSDEPFTIRFGIEMLMTHFLDDEFDPNYLSWVASITNDHYYVRMMIAWYFATALSKQWKATLPYLSTRHLEKWTHNKAIQKAIESYRITKEQRVLLREMKIK